MVKRGPQLPGQLLEELGFGSSSQSGKGGRGKLSRKDARKLDRQDRKSRKAEHHTRAHVQPQDQANTLKRTAAREPPQSPPRKKARFADAPPVKAPLSPSEPLPPERLAAQKSKSALAKLAERSQKPAAPLRSEREKQEDAYISYLESKLGWRKGRDKTKSYGSGLDEDGLDGLLDGLDNFDDLDDYPSIEEGSEYDADENLQDVEYDPEDLEEQDEGSGDEAEFGDEDDKSDVPEMEREWGGISSGEVEENVAQTNAEDEVTQLIPASTERYVPPALRNQGDVAADSEEVAKLKRQIKGQINRLSEQNIASIIDTVEELYRKNRRNDVSSNITRLIIESVSSHAILLDSYVVLNAAFVTALFKTIGQDFGANFVQQVITSYDAHRKHRELVTDLSQTNAGGKESSNLIVLLTELYNFQVVSCVLMYDIIREFLDGELGEFDVELLLKIMRNCGNQLRQDDPSALKDIIQIVQTRVSGQDNTSSRTRFMLETLISLKNNKLKKTGNAGQTGGNEAVERMKKFLNGLEKKRHVLAHEPLRMSLGDLRSADTKGKWWIVGAAWGGDPLVERQHHLQQEAPKSSVGSENVLLKLAKKQGMNTDIRRSIFVILMSSDDYVDASERLAQLNLTEVQQREIVRVILHCCGNEKAYNPYYTLVAQHLCANSHSYKITLQFTLWDFLRDLGERSVGGAEVVKSLEESRGGDFGDEKTMTEYRIRNIARLYAWLLAKNRLTLAILKPVDFSVLKGQARLFFIELFTHIFFSSHLANPSVTPEKAIATTFDQTAIEEVFIKAVKMPNISTGIVFFLSKHVASRAEGAQEDFVGRACEVAMETLRTGLDVGSFL